MKAIYNSRILPVEKISLEIHNRAFCYGDGLFETIVTGPDRINLTHYHMARLTRASAILHIEIPFDTELLENMMEGLKKANDLSGDCRFRLQLWRDTGGLYEPVKHSASFLLSCDATDYPYYNSISDLGISEKARVVEHPLSFAKSMSALPYVMAGLERKETGFDDLIITNERGMMAEAIVSNLFWCKDNQFFTPSLSTGCIAGTMRAYLIEAMAKNGITVAEVEAEVEVLEDADEVFLTNAAGIRWVASVAGTSYADPYHKLAPYLKLPLQP